MKYSNTLIAVQDMDKSLAFYKDLFNEEVAVDLGWCKSLTCGLTLQIHFEQIAGFPIESMKYHSNTMELYFETEDFDEFIQKLDQYPQVERLHEPKTYPWLQRGIHIFDPDGHLIEVSESMFSVGCRLFDDGKNTEEVAELTQHPLPVVQEWYKGYQSAHLGIEEVSVIPYLSFAGNCEEAINMYLKAFGGKIFFVSHWDDQNYEVEAQIGKIMHMEFSLGNTHMSAGDSYDTNSVNTDIKLMIHTSSEAQVRKSIAVLAEGGTVISPLKPHPAPDDGGMGSITKDRFGFTWIITCPNENK